MGIRIKNKILEIPIIQGGMGVGVSLGRLAGAVMSKGAMGTISAAQPGFGNIDFKSKTLESNLNQLDQEVVKARKGSKGKGILAVNIMVANSTYAEMVKQAVKSGVDAIVSGAGLPLELPELVNGSEVAIAPIVSSGRAANVICRSWKRKYNRIPDFIIVEGPEAGGHLGFSESELNNKSHKNLMELLEDVKEATKPYSDGENNEIPIFVAGGVYTKKDIDDYLEAGATGVQMGTRFIATEECDATDEYKEQFIKAKKEDITLVKSPAGLPGRAIRNPFLKKVNEGRVKPLYCTGCLLTCNPKTTPYCISHALINAVTNRVDEGLVFSGTNGWKIDKIISVSSLIDELTGV